LRRARVWCAALLAMSAFSARADDATPPREAAEAEYARKRVGFSSGEPWPLATNGFAHRGAPYLGRGVRWLDLDEFYEAVGRADHASYYRRRTRIKFGVMVPSIFFLVGGAATAIAGGVVGVASAPCTQLDPAGECLVRDTRPNYAALGTGLGLFGVGLIGTIASALIHRFPTDAAGAFHLAAEHDRKLRERLGLPPVHEPDLPDGYETGRAPTATPRGSISLAPTVSPRAGGLALGGSF
jgi:hypothetical protein